MKTASMQDGCWGWPAFHVLRQHTKNITQSLEARRIYI